MVKGRTVQVYDRQFKQYSRNAIHPRISELLDELPKGSLLDFPAGSGALSYRLHNEGFDVTACDICPEAFEPDEIKVVSGDLCQSFPFQDNSFDYATFVEGPEHAENPFFAIRQFARILKPGGRLVISIPNYTNLEKRLQFLLWGTGEKAVPFERVKDWSLSEFAMLHLTPMTYTQLRCFLEYSGFEIERVAKDAVKAKQQLLKPIALLIQALSKLQGCKGQENYWLQEANANEILMGGNTLIIIARLRHDAVKLAA